MANSSSLIKTILHKSLAEGVYRDLVNRTSNYYYFLGKTLEWEDELNPPYPVDSYAYEKFIRSEIITMKQISPSDVSFVIPRTNWTPGVIYDMYDDEYSDELSGVNIISGGQGYTSVPTLTVTGGGGQGASFTASISNGQIVSIQTVSRGFGYTSTPTINIIGGGGFNAVLSAVLNKSASGSSKLEDCLFYVMTDQFNVYKCLDNNDNARSTSKPLGTSVSPIKTADGYVWKFMYNVPINLRNKFLSEAQIPVISALTNQFYTNGTLDNIVITNKGTGYTSANISVIGDGYREEDPVFLNGLTISNAGSGYLTPTLTIGDPVSDATPFIPNIAVFLGQLLFTASSDFYEVVTPGTVSLVEPSHKKGVVQNGTAALKFVGTRARGIVTVSNGQVTGVTLVGAVREIVISSGGSGYTTPPVVSFIGGGGSGAQAAVKLNTQTGSVLYAEIINPGDNYVNTPDVIFGTAWSSGLTVNVGEQYFIANRLYTVTTSGVLGLIAPTHTSGSASNGNAVLVYAGSPAIGNVIRRFGAGYSGSPTVSITEVGASGATASFSTTKSEAKLLPILENGQFVGVIPENAGIGYSSVTVTVSGDGQGAVLTPDLNIGNVSSLQANNEILAVSGTIDAIKIISGGYSYGVAVVSIEGDGTGATAEAVVNNTTGRITKINITNPGRNYTYANVTVTGNGFGAKLRAIMSPYGGHGKNSPDELFARTLMFYSNVSTDLNQGISINNDYRQVGIIKNPRIYGDQIRFQSNVGSACFIVEALVNTTSFPPDENIFVTRTIGSQSYARRYRVVSSSPSNILLQSLDNDTPLINDTFVNSSGQTFTVNSVGNPTVDKYSGQMMFIDNKAGFTPSADETVTLRTVIRF
jgi:hypothetical protein